MSVQIIPCSTTSDFKDFVDLPFRIYKNNKYWVPSIKKEEIKALTPDTNPAFKNCDAQFWLAKRDGRVVGRVGAIINHLHNKQTNKNLCRVSRIEFEDDTEVSTSLLKTVEDWAKQKGMSGVHGPLGFTNLDHQAILIEGFDHLPSIASEYHLPYYQKHIENYGYEKEIDWLEFRLKQEKEIPEKALKLNEMIKKRYNLHVVHFNNREELKSYAVKIFKLLNESFSELFGFVPMDEELTKYYSSKYFQVLNPKFVKAIEDKDENVIGFIVSVPSLSVAMQKANGSIFPFGWWYISQALKKNNVADLLLTGIHPNWQSQGVSAILITELTKVLIEHNIEYVETTGMLETNEKAINNWKIYEHIQHKRKRCFIKMF